MVTGTGRLRLSGSPTAVFARSQRGAYIRNKQSRRMLPQPTYYSVFSLSRASARMGEAAGNPAPAMRLQDIRVDFKCHMCSMPRGLFTIRFKNGHLARCQEHQAKRQMRDQARAEQRLGRGRGRGRGQGRRWNVSSVDEDTDATETFILCFFRIF